MTGHPLSSIEELNSLFGWCPPSLKVDPAYVHHTHVETESSLRATFYDMHLAPDLVCKRVIHVKNLHNKVASVVDQQLQTIQDNGVVLPPPDDMESTGLRNKKVREAENVMKDEISVVEFYRKTTTRYCVRIASSLALHPTIWSSVLHWSAVPCLGERNIPGGSLQVLTPRTSDEDGDSTSTRDFVDSNTWAKLMVVKDKYQDLATWRMMGPSAEDTEVMLGLMATGDSEGFDWKLPAALISNVPSLDWPALSNPRRPLDAAETTSLLTTSYRGPYHLTTQPSTTLETTLDDALKRGGSSLKDLRKDRPPSRIIRAWSDDSTDESISTQPPVRRITSQTLIQEAWSQSVRQNTTLLVIHSGNLEYICFRHRASQTLYISDVLHVPRLRDPGYGKVQVGLYITAVTDAFQRLTSDNSSSEATSPGRPADGATLESEAQRHINQPSGKRSRAVGTVHPRKRGSGDTVRDLENDDSEDRELDANWIIQQAVSRTVLHLHLQYGIYGSTNPSTFCRGSRTVYSGDETPSATSPLADITPTTPRFFLFLTSELGHGAMGITHEGWIRAESKYAHAKLHVAAKLAFTTEQQEDVAHEHSIYIHLKAQGVCGIPSVYGIFHDVELMHGPTCLLMSHMGTSLRVKQSLFFYPISAAQRDAFLDVLRAIHNARVLHRDLRLENLLVRDSGEVAIIDFDQAKMDASDDELHDEYEDLCDLLEDLVEHPVETAETAPEIQGKGKGKAAEAAETVGASRMRTRQTRAVEAVDTSDGKASVAEVDAPGKTKDQMAIKAKTKAVGARPNGGAKMGSKAKAIPGARGRHALTANAHTGPSGISDDRGLDKPRMSGKMVLRPKPPQVRR